MTKTNLKTSVQIIVLNLLYVQYLLHKKLIINAIVRAKELLKYLLQLSFSFNINVIKKLIATPRAPEKENLINISTKFIIFNLIFSVPVNKIFSSY